MELKYINSIKTERPVSEGDQIKAAIRELFCESRKGASFSEDAPLIKKITRVNGNVEQLLALYKLPTDKDSVVLKYIGNNDE